MEIKVDTNAITKAINDMNTEILNLRDSLSNVKRISLSELHDHWQGSDYDNAYEGKMTNFVEDLMISYLDSIESYQKYLQNYLKGFQAIHRHYEGKKITIVGR
ncbi:MAG: hypothetical protein HFI09_01695 [Bacilli bacterium]|nr:hypothetical protein [Bacilli bacterium]